MSMTKPTPCYFKVNAAHCWSCIDWRFCNMLSCDIDIKTTRFIHLKYTGDLLQFCSMFSFKISQFDSQRHVICRYKVVNGKGFYFEWTLSSLQRSSSTAAWTGRQEPRIKRNENIMFMWMFGKRGTNGNMEGNTRNSPKKYPPQIIEVFSCMPT